MEKVEYTEYSEVINPDGEQIEVVVQIPKNPEHPVLIIDKSGPRFLKRSLNEWSAINDVVKRALQDAGWEKENTKGSS